MAATEEHLTVAPIVGAEDPRRFTDSGIEIAELYTQEDLPENLDLGEPGEFPYTRGVHREMTRLPLAAEATAFLAAASVRLLDGADRIVVFGIGPSAALATYVSISLARSGRRSRTIGATGSMLADQLLDLHAGTVVAPAAFSPPLD